MPTKKAPPTPAKKKATPKPTPKTAKTSAAKKKTTTVPARNPAKKPARTTKKPALAKKPSAAKKPAPPKKPAAGKGPVHIISYDKGFGLFFACDAFEDIGAMDLFESVGALGNGYGWESVIAPAVEARAPGALEALAFDCEADTFAVRSDTEPPLRALLEVIETITKSPAALAAALEARDPERD